jgi:dienelactone hydrolase
MTIGHGMQSGLSRREALAALLAGCAPLALLRSAAAADIGWLDDVQQSPKTLPVDAPKLAPLLVDDDGGKIETVKDWQRRRTTIRRWWLDFLGTLKPDRNSVPKLTVIDEDYPEGVIRQLVRYEAEPGDVTEGYLLKPAAPAGRRPGVVVFHSTVENSILQPAGIGMADDAPKVFGLGLARRGYVAFCPRNYLWPENTKMSNTEAVARFSQRHPGVKGMSKMLYDGVVALDILAGLPDVDPARLATVGHSLGGKETLYLAAFDERVRVTVSSEGGIGTKFSNWDAPWYLGGDIRRDDFTHEHHELLGLIAPRAFLLLAGDDGNGADGPRSWPFIEAAMPVYRLCGGTPRLGMFNHGKGHSMPPEAEQRMYEWLDAYL